MRWVIALVLAGCGFEIHRPTDYAPADLRALGIHASATYVARDLMAVDALPLVLAHPRLGQPAIRMAGEMFEVRWIAPNQSATAAQISLSSGMQLASGVGNCDGDGICALQVAAPELPNGLYGICVQVGVIADCSPSALAMVDAYHDPVTIVHVSDSHVGEGTSLGVFAGVIDAIDALDPPADLVVFTGDGADKGLADERAAFIAQLARLTAPVFVVTGNHDFDNWGLVGHLLDVGPELDIEARYGGLRLVGLSTGQDMDGDHDQTTFESDGPDESQLAWLESTLDDTPTVMFLHHPIYNGLDATVGPQSRDRLKRDVTRPSVLAVLAGHTHVSAVFDAVGDSRGLSLGAGEVPAARWPLHYVAARATTGEGGFAVLHVGPRHIDYRWQGFP